MYDKRLLSCILCLLIGILLVGCGGDDSPLETDPPVHAPQTAPSETRPPETEPPVTEPPETEPPETTAPPVIVPPETEPPKPVVPADTEKPADTTPVETVEPVVAEGEPDAIDLRGKLAVGKNVKGRFVSHQSTKLALVVDYTAAMEESGEIAVALAIGLQTYDINCGSRIDMGAITVDGETKTFSTEAIVHETSKKIIIPFTTHSYKIEPDQKESRIDVSWIFNGMYGGKKLEKLTASAVLTLGDQ